MNRKLLIVVFTAFCLTSLAACGGGNGNINNAVSIAFSQAPPAALQTSAMATVSATVFNSSNTGVDWTVTCGGADCGSLSTNHTDGGASLTYTAPASVPTGNTVTITATASADSSVSVVGTTTITTGSTTSALNGQYTFIVSGQDTTLISGQVFIVNYVAAGSIVADGNGTIMSGEEDICDLATPCAEVSLGGSYSSGPDGRGSINLTSSSFNSVQTLEFVLTSTNHALITEFDSSASASGTLDLQDPNALDASGITGGFSIALNGEDVQSGEPAAVGGVMTGDASGDFNNVTLDTNDPSGNGFTTETTNLLVLSGPDPFGRVAVSDGTLIFAYYIVNAKAVRFIELDDFFQTTGSAYTQGSGSLTTASLAGNSVFTDAGMSVLGQVGVGGEFTADTNGNVTAGFTDVNDDGSATNGSIAGSTFSSFVSGRGSLTLSGGVSSDVTEFQVYLVDPSVNILDPTLSMGGGGALLLDSDANAVGAGAIIPQANSPSFNGNYGENLQALDQNLDEVDMTGQVIATGSSSLSGTGDLNNFGTGQLLPAQALSGTITADGSHTGRFTGTLTIGSSGTLNLVYYQATNSQIVLVDVDTGNTAEIGTGVLLQQQ